MYFLIVLIFRGVVMFKLYDICILKCSIKCITGCAEKGEPVQIIRLRGSTVDVVNLRNDLIFKVPLNCLYLFSSEV